jgi:hypothetical protein
VRYGCLKITRNNEGSSKVGKHENIWDNGETRDNATWASSKLKYRGNLRFLEKTAIMFCSQLYFVRLKASLVAYDVRELFKKSMLKKS